MAQFTGDSIERVKEAADIVEVVSAYTDLRRSGTRFSGLCPFHDERTPSFSVDPAAKLYHCFGCGVGGDVIKFVEEKEGLSFPDAVESLADRYGVELQREREDPRAEEQRKRRTRLGELLERTAAFYGSFLWESPQARKARDYLAGRGLGEDVLREFGVGFAPGKWDTVLVRGQRAGYSVEEMRAAGLVQASQKGRGDYDAFRSRIMFPIRDARGRVQGFGGRAVLPDQKPKYKNSPEGELYRKRRTLFAIDRARPAITKEGRAVVVEGYTDVLASHQAGITEAVAVMGTAITPEQVRILAAYTDEVVLALDADRSGREAMLRAQTVASGKRVRLRVARLSEGKDPADLLTDGDDPARMDAAERFRAAVSEAEELPVFHVRMLLGDADTGSPAGRDRALDEAVPVIAAMPDSITREELMREVADRLGADPGLVARRVAGSGRRAAETRALRPVRRRRGVR
jgi:DNA primase